VRGWVWLAVGCGIEVGTIEPEERPQGCAPEPKPPPIGDCDVVGTWRSVEEQEGGRGEDGPALCRWTIAFHPDGSFDWQYSDIAERGTWTCADGEITGSTGQGSFFPPDELVWDGVDYEPRQ